MNETDKLVEEQFEKLPLNLQQAIKAVPWKSLVEEIGRANALNAEQIALLEQETMFIIYAFENPDDYVSNIARALNTSEEIAYNIAESIGNKIFVPISEKSEQQNITTPINNTLEIPPNNLPMVEAGPAFAQGFGEAKKVAHDVAPATSEVGSREYEVRKEEPKAPLPDYRYEGGKDPYREPLK